MKNIDKLLAQARKNIACSKEDRRKKELANMTDEELDERIELLRQKLGISRKQYEAPDFYAWSVAKLKQLRGKGT